MKKLESFQFGRRKGTKWDHLMDGGIYELKKGEDFTCAPSSMRTSLNNAARGFGKRFRSSIVDENTIVVQAYTPEVNGKKKKS